VGLLAVVVWAGAAAAESVPKYRPSYKGTSRPPGTITVPHKSIWMTEWVACNQVSLKTLASQLSMKVPPHRTPLQDAKILANRAMQFLYETDAETTVAIDGCTNGILWRYFHQQS
jgi:hypothetical protein